MSLAITNNSRSFFANPYNESTSLTKINIAEKRLKAKKEYLEDVKNELRLLELDAYNTYMKEVMYVRFMNGIISKAKKWLEMLYNKELKIDKRKKYDEKVMYETLTDDLRYVFDQPDIKITRILQYGYNNSADIIEFDCRGYHFQLSIPVIKNITLKDYQDSGAYAFQIHLHVNERPNVYNFVGVTFEEDDLKDILNKWFAEKLPEALANTLDENLDKMGVVRRN